MKYIIDNTTYETAEQAAQAVIDSIEDTDAYDEMLDECTGAIKIGSLEYSASEVLQRVDPIAYRCGFSDFLDGEYSDILYSLERMDGGDTENFYDVEVEAVEDEDEDSEEQ